MIRSIASVIIGFLAFLIAVIMLFWGFGYGFKVAPPSSFLMFSAFCQAIFSLGSGYLTALIAKRREVLQAAVLAAIFISIELVSLIFQKQKSPYWMILSLIVINPSCVLLGGYLRKKASDKGSRQMPS